MPSLHVWGVLKVVLAEDSFILPGGFKAHNGSDSVTWNGALKKEEAVLDTQVNKGAELSTDYHHFNVPHLPSRGERHSLSGQTSAPT